jgi:AraC family transcriptional regulator
LLSSQTLSRDPLILALRRKARIDAPGMAVGNTLAVGEGWRVVDIVCTSGPRDRSFEERHLWASISLVLSGVFIYRSRHGSSLMAPGAMLLGSPDNPFECLHRHSEGDRCLSFQYDPELFEPLARDAGAPRFAFTASCLPPLRAMASLTARAAAAAQSGDSFEEIANELAGAVLQKAGHARRHAVVTVNNPGAIAGVLRRLESSAAEPHSLDDLARIAGLSRYHFLRTFRCVTGVTPHQWLLRARLRDAAHRLATTVDSVTDIALDVGFEDLSNFIRSFRAEFGVSPGRYRADVS